MHRSIVCLYILLFGLSISCRKSDRQPDLAVPRVQLPNGWALSPAGRHLPLGDLPLNMALVPGGRQAVITLNGYGKNGLVLIDLEGEAVLDQVEMPAAWYGLAVSREGVIYASAGNDNCVRTFRIEGGRFLTSDSLLLGRPWPEDTISVTGLALDENKDRLFVITKEDNALYVLNTKSKSVEKKIALDAEAYDCRLSPDGRQLYISLWGGGTVVFYDTDREEIVHKLPVGGHPNDMVLSADGRFLFVACSDDNAVAVVDVENRRIVEMIVASLYPDAPTGSTSNSVALSPDGHTLAVANADNNCLALFDISEPGESRSLGFIPTGWYPTAVEIIGSKLLVVNGKGMGSNANPQGPNPHEPRTDSTQYIGDFFPGSLSFIDYPQLATLADYSRQVYENTPYNQEKERLAAGEPGNPIPRAVGDASPIRYVFYVIKENRTYDQVLGDLPEGNGDPYLCLFPDSVTPNHHALAREFVLLDNFYVNAEVSADGHNWSTAAYANDYVEKTWPAQYSDRGGTYDYEGQKDIAYPRDGFIWDFCRRAGISFRTYGEFANLNEAYHQTLEGHTCPRFPGYNLTITDAYRFEQWRIDFDSLLRLGEVPRLNIVRLPNDHTAGARAGRLTPAAMVADNDLAVGRLVEHISQSPIWQESVIFILEDDAQNGPDHVDAHRSICLVAGPHVRRGHVEHTMYSTSSVLRTIELILGLPAMSQYDAAATPLFACFTSAADDRPYTARPNNIDLQQRNPPDTRLSRLSSTINLNAEDQAPDLLFSEIIWKTVRGEGSEMPAPRRSAFVLARGEEEDED